MTYKITVELNPSIEDKTLLSNKIIDFNYQKTGFIATPFSLFLRDENDLIVGGIRGVIYGGGAFVDVLYVDDELRGKGHGTQLMRQVELEAINNGCTFTHLDTFSFQALPFYQKLGYTIFGELEYSPTVKRYFLKKELQK